MKIRSQYKIRKDEKSIRPTPMLFKTVQAKKLDPRKLITHHFKLSDIVQAYETFSNAATEKALKVILTHE